MSTSVRSYLVAGAAAATATAIALTPVQAAPADIAVPAQPTSAQPQLTQAMIDLLAAASRMTAAVAPNLSGTADAPTLGLAPAAATTPEVGVQNAAGNFVESAYLGIQEWVDWAVDYGTDLAYWVGQWVPFVSPITTQVDIFYWELIRPIANAVALTFLVPVINDPLNLGVWINSAGAAITQSLQAAVNFGVAEFNQFFGWIIPPLPPPFPTVASVATTETLATPLASGLRDLVGDLVVRPSADFMTSLAAPTAISEGITQRPLESVTAALTKVGENLATTLEKLAEGTGIESLADRLNAQVAGAEQTLVTEVTDGVNDTVEADSNDAEQQLNPATAEISAVPKSVRQSLRSTAGDTTTITDSEDTAQADEAPARSVRSVRQGLRDAVGKSTADAAKKAGDDARDAVKAAVKHVAPKPKLKKEKAVSSKDSQGTKDSSDNGKPAKDKK
ncbi:DNA-directed RNA polymerase I subunit RPA34 [Mycolicibacterium neworleansense]|uniref:PE-PGRS family protein n=1 Tax=Mycolicibacterium neworleansense TaxID=146018 RepID=A0A0H5RXD4_9MYCO|nr:DNA-directed RNA polymerase I subunit RPA34 [Mycolicibacterium neworleansense]MCV7360792.1 hypothetical protein [Mycolicibacterium neworleansense]CRZ18202.1 hypothetical protein BN2156_05103 [Mycolicibacterium neworleansense]